MLARAGKQHKQQTNGTRNTLWHPEVSLEVAVLLYGVLGIRVERAYCGNSMSSIENHVVW